MPRMRSSAGYVAAAIAQIFVLSSMICSNIAVALPDSPDDALIETVDTPTIRAVTEESGTNRASETTGEPETLEEPATTRQPAMGQTAFEGVSDLDLFERIAVSLANLETMQARFNQTSPEGEVIGGTLFLDRPGFLKFSYTPPHPQIIIAREGMIYVHDTELETTLQYETAKTPLRFLLAEILSLDNVAMVALERAKNSVALTVEAKDESMEGQLSMVFTAPDLQLTRWAVIDGLGGITLVDLSEIEENKAISRDVFDTSDFDID